MESKHLPSDYMDTLLQELLTLKQRTLSLDDRTEKFSELTICCTFGEADRVTVNCYEIQCEMVMYDFESVDDVHRKVR